MPMLLCEKGHYLLKEAMKKILILSDIHGNITALNKTLEHKKSQNADGIILLGDLIDYGPGSNEVIKRIADLPKEKILVNIWGNHEHAVMNEEYSRFSSKRGAESAKYTRKGLEPLSMNYLRAMNRSGMEAFMLCGFRCLAVHGSLEDVFWKSIDVGEGGPEYCQYDYVFSGHSHVSHMYQHFYECDRAEFRNKKRTVFINPGSVGQPRNHNPYAQFAVWDADSGEVEFVAVQYDVETEAKRYSNEIDSFYKERIKRGI